MKRKISNEIIIEAAIDIAKEKGLYNITLNDIAKHLGVKSPSLYNHITGIQDLYVELGIYSVNRLLKKLTNAIVGLSKREAIEAMTNAYFHFFVENRVLIDAIENPFVIENVKLNEKKEQIVNIIMAILSKYNRYEIENIHIVRTIRSYLFGFIKLEMNGLFQMKLETQDSFDSGMIAILNGFNL